MNLSDQILEFYSISLLALIIALLSGNMIWLLIPIIILTSKVIRYSQQDELVPALEISRTINSKRYKETDHIIVLLEIVNTSNTTFRGEIVDTLPESAVIIEGSNITLAKIKPEEIIYVQYKISFNTRGQYIIGPIRSQYHSMGEYHHQIVKYDIEFEILIVPIPDNISKFNLPPNFLTSLGGPFKSKLVGEGMEFTSVREYQVGDPYRRINWKQTARNRTLYSNEFEISRASNFYIVIDMTEEDNEVINYAVRAVLGLASYLMNFRCKVGLVTLSEYVHVIPQKSGKRHLIELTEHLTRVKSLPEISSLDLFKNRFRDGISKIKYENNEIILFSSINSHAKTVYICNNLIMRGNLTIISPTAVQYDNIDNRLYQLSKKMVDLRNNVITNFMFKKKIKLYEWIPGFPFDLSASNWRKQR